MLQDRISEKKIGFSVIIPVYNKKDYIEKCIDSVINSSYTNVEVICVDDFSTDGSRDILKKYVQKNEKITLIENCENRGVSYSRNVGINAAKGKYIMFLDSDDFLDKYALENYYEKLEKTNAQGCFIKIVSNNGNVSISNLYKKVYLGRELLGEFVLNDEMFLYACGCIWATEFIRNNIMFKELKIGEGGLFILEALMQAERVVVSDYPGYNYCVNELSTSNKSDSMKLSAMGQLKQIIFMILQFEANINDKEIVTFLRWYLKKNMGGINNLNMDDFDSQFLQTTSEKFLAELVKGEYLENKIVLSEDDEKIVREKGCVYIYGAGYETLNVIKLCNRLNLEIKGIYVSSQKGNQKNIYGFHVNEIHADKISDLSIPFLVSAHKKHHEVISEKLNEIGVRNIIMVSD